MKNLKVKSILFSLLAMMAVAVFLTSCEQEVIFEDDLTIEEISTRHCFDAWCNDGNPMTINDRLNEDCECVGTIIRVPDDCFPVVPK